MITKDLDVVTSKVKKVSLVYHPTKDTEIFGGLAIYDPHTNQIICQVSDTASFVTNQSLISLYEKQGWEFMSAHVNNARTLFHISGLLPTILGDDDGVDFQTGIEITNSYNNTYVSESRLFYFSKDHNIILRTCFNPKIDPQGLATFQSLMKMNARFADYVDITAYPLPRKIKQQALKYFKTKGISLLGKSSWDHFKAFGYACHTLWEQTAYVTARKFMVNFLSNIIYNKRGEAV